MKYSVFSVVLLLLFLGCAKEEPYRAYKYPSWYYEPPKSEFYYYAIGEGGDIQEAKGVAINNLLEQIQEPLDANRSLFIRLSPPRVLEMIEHKRSVVLLLSVEKKALYEINKKYLDLLFIRLQRIDESSSDEFMLRYVALKRGLDEIGDLQARLAFLSMLDSSFDPEPYRQKYGSYQQKITLLLEAIRISLHSDFESIDLVEVIEAHLKEQKIEILEGSSRFVSDYGLYLSGSCNSEQFRLEVVLKNFVDEVVARNRYTFTCEDSNKSVKAFRSLLKKEGIYTFFGIRK